MLQKGEQNVSCGVVLHVFYKGTLRREAKHFKYVFHRVTLYCRMGEIFQIQLSCMCFIGVH